MVKGTKHGRHPAQSHPRKIQDRRSRSRSADTRALRWAADSIDSSNKANRCSADTFSKCTGISLRFASRMPRSEAFDYGRARNAISSAPAATAQRAALIGLFRIDRVNLFANPPSASRTRAANKGKFSWSAHRETSVRRDLRRGSRA